MPHLPPTPTPEAVVASLGDAPGVVWLDGGHGVRDGWTIVAWSPDEVVRGDVDWPRAGAALRRPPREGPALPWRSGVIGLLGYGAGAAVAPVPPCPDPWTPSVWLGRYAGGLVLEHRTGRWHATGSAARRAEARAVLARASQHPLGPVPPPPPRVAGIRTVPRHRHEAGVRTVLHHITEGDVYQLNLTRPVWVDGVGQPPLSVYRRLRRRSPAPLGAYLRLDGATTVLSNSPEHFLSLAGRTLCSVPIKGTRPRHADADHDARLAAALATSPKEQAELTMIVDLVRNDLGRVATPGSVQVGPRTLTAHANVHHAAQAVSAELAEGLGAWDALAASFPPGSVTGCPKPRACQRIHELEDGPRGVYCGAVGFVDDGGAARWSVAIRTAVLRGDRARYHVGGGLVADSTPAAEWRETVDKGTALAWALTGLDRPEEALDAEGRWRGPPRSVRPVAR